VHVALARARACAYLCTYEADGSPTRSRCGILIKNILGLIKKCHVAVAVIRTRRTPTARGASRVVCRRGRRAAGTSATGGDYVGRKIIFKFFLQALIDPPSLFLSYSVSSWRRSLLASRRSMSLLQRRTIALRYFFSVELFTNCGLSCRFSSCGLILVSIPETSRGGMYAPLHA